MTSPGASALTKLPVRFVPVYASLRSCCLIPWRAASMPMTPTACLRCPKSPIQACRWHHWHAWEISRWDHLGSCDQRDKDETEAAQEQADTPESPGSHDPSGSSCSLTRDAGRSWRWRAVADALRAWPAGPPGRPVRLAGPGM